MHTHTHTHTQVFLSLLAISVAVDIIHEKGRCLWYKQCTDQECPKSDAGQYYNLYNNSWHINVTEQSDKQLFDLLEEVCPMYIGEFWEEIHIPSGFHLGGEVGGGTLIKMKGTKVQTLGGRAVAGAWLVAWAIMAMGAIINTHAHR